MAAERVRAGAGSVRVRTTAAAVGIVGVALLIGAVALVLLMRSTLTNEVQVAARAMAAELVTALEAGTPPAEAPLSTSDDVIVQLVDEDGAVIDATPKAAGLPPLADLAPGEWARVTVPQDDDEFLVVSATAITTEGRLTVLLGRTLDAVAESTELVTGLLAVGLPVLLVIVGATAWLLVGRALAPVEAMRREVDEISATELHRRVPDPSGTDEISRLASTMNQMLDRLERAQARQRQFVADTSHELRSPIASIRQHAEVAIAHPGLSTVADLAETVLAEDLRLQRLVDDLLLLARADERTLQLHVRPVDLDDLVFEEAARLRAATTLRIDSTGVSAGRVDGDAAGLRRVLANLGENAARHARGEVAFSLATDADTIVLRVDDDGPGVPLDDRQRVFDRFVRLDAARARDAGGSGLGLAIVAELVAAHGGTVEIADSPLGGARVEVQLPLGAIG